jgi:hypothetical protein
MHVQSLRLAKGWRRRTSDNTELADQKTETFTRVHAALEEGTCRSYGRGLLQSYLRVQGYITREDDVRDAIAFYDPRGTRARRRGPDKHRKDGEFITPAANEPISARRTGRSRLASELLFQPSIFPSVRRHTWNIISDDGDWSTAERGKNWSIYRSS